MLAYMMFGFLDKLVLKYNLGLSSEISLVEGDHMIMQLVEL